MLIISQGLKILHGKIEKMSFDNENQCPPYMSLQRGSKTVARFLLFFYSIDIDTLEVELKYI